MELSSEQSVGEAGGASPLNYFYCHLGWACRTQSEPVLTDKEGWSGMAIVSFVPLRSGLGYHMGHHERLELEPGGAVLLSPKRSSSGSHTYQYLKGIGHGGCGLGGSLASGYVSTLLEVSRICHSLGFLWDWS